MLDKQSTGYRPKLIFMSIQQLKIYYILYLDTVQMLTGGPSRLNSAALAAAGHQTGRWAALSTLT